MKYSLLPTLLLLISPPKAVDEEMPTGNEAVSIFNGTNLSGWRVVTQKGVPAASHPIFSVSDGMIHVYAESPDKSRQPFAGLITEVAHSNYVLKLEYKWGEKKFAPRDDFVRDAGIIFHMHGPNVIWPSGVECQIQEGDTGDIWAINTQVSSTVQPTIRNYQSEPGGKLETRGNEPKGFARFHRSYCRETSGWNHIEIMVKGDQATIKINGHLTNEAINMKQWDNVTKSWVPLTEGKILLQAEGAEVFYRNIQITTLSPDKSR